jgi:hypothetical protein
MMIQRILLVFMCCVYASQLNLKICVKYGKLFVFVLQNSLYKHIIQVE